MVELQQALKDFVSNRVKVSGDDRKSGVAVVRTWVEKELVSRMRKMDPLFELLYGGIYYAGSAYEGLKVSKANEFDLNIILKLPFRQRDVLIMHRGVPHGFVCLQLTSSVEALLERHPQWTVLSRLKEFFEVTGSDRLPCLSRKKLAAWFQSVVDRTLNRDGGALPGKVSRRCSGPAATLVITSISKEGPDLDIDLVPVIPLETCPGSVVHQSRRNPKIRSFPKASKPRSLPGPTGNGQPQHGTVHPTSRPKTCFIVPKQAPDHLTAGQPGEGCMWAFFRVSMPDAERDMLNDKGCVKMLIKIFKAIRDKEKWKFLPSYYIKTVFMWTIRENPECDWSEANLVQLFKMMLAEFIDVFHRHHLPHIFFPGFNLLASVPKTSLTTTKKRLEAISRGTAKTTIEPKFAEYFEAVSRGTAKATIEPKFAEYFGPKEPAACRAQAEFCPSKEYLRDLLKEINSAPIDSQFVDECIDKFAYYNPRKRH